MIGLVFSSLVVLLAAYVCHHSGRSANKLSCTGSRGFGLHENRFNCQSSVATAAIMPSDAVSSPEPYESDTLHPFFDNLLPEGTAYEQTARRLGLRRADRFGMLLHVGGDVMGAVEVLPELPS